MWGERSHDAIRPSDGGFFQSSGHEGDFVSVRRPFEWKKGKYTYRLTRMDQEMIDGKPYTWVGAFVYSHEKDENVFVGALRFKGEKLVLDRKVANFVEVYGRRRPVADIPKVTVTFGPPVVNGKARQEPHGGSDLPEGRAGLRRHRGEGRFAGRHGRPAGRGPGETPGEADRRPEVSRRGVTTFSATRSPLSAGRARRETVPQNNNRSHQCARLKSGSSAAIVCCFPFLVRTTSVLSGCTASTRQNFSTE